MFIPIPTGLTYTVKLSGATIKEVVCERCGTEFVYLLQKAAEGTGESLFFLDNSGAESRAGRAAKKRLKSALGKGFRIVHCPACGCFQRQMVRKRKLWNLITVAFAWTLCLGSVALVLEVNHRNTIGESQRQFIYLTISIFFLMTGAWLALRDHNAKAAARAGRGQADVMLKSQHDALLAEEQRKIHEDRERLAGRGTRKA